MSIIICMTYIPATHIDLSINGLLVVATFNTPCLHLLSISLNLINVNHDINKLCGLVRIIRCVSPKNISGGFQKWGHHHIIPF